MTTPFRSGMAAVRQLVRTRRAAAGAVVLAYHDIVSEPTENQWSVSIDDFVDHLSLLRRLGLAIVDLSTIVERMEAGRSLDGLAAITFDDALRGVHEFALPALDEAGLSATIFVVSGELGASPSWWPGSSRTMTPDELVAAAKAGHRLAAHTRSHRSLPSLDDFELRAELTGCRADLEALTEARVDLLAYPSGHQDVRVRRIARECGYVAGFTFLNGRLTGSEDPFLLPRLTLGGHSSRPRLAYHLLRPPEMWPDHQLEEVTGNV